MVKKLDRNQEKLLQQIGEEVRRLRKEKTNLNSEDFAKLIRMEKKTYYKIERGNQDYNISSLVKIFTHWNIDLKDFLKKI